MKRLRGFTLFELIVTMMVAAIIAAAVAPLFGDDDRLHVMAATSIVASDIELAQVMTIAHPGQPVVVRFDPANARYWLAYAATPDTPLLREDNGEPYEVVLGIGRARGAAGVSIVVEQMTNNRMTFASHGGLADFSTTPLIKLTSGGRGIQLAIAPTTGSVHETELADTAPIIEVEALGEE